MELHSKLEGLYKFEAVKIVEGVEIYRRPLTDWIPNLITNGGLDRFAAYNDYMFYCQVGSSNTTPTNSDTGLGSQIAYTSSGTYTGAGVDSVSPYYRWERTIFRFAEGTAAGNLSEVGVSWHPTIGIFSRALILDINGDPTTITVLSDETLDVTYEFRTYPKLTDSTGTIVFTGNIGGTYDWITRTANITSGYPDTQPPKAAAGYLTQSFNGTIGAITSSPSGTAGSGLSHTIGSYVSGNYYRDFTYTASLTDANISGGIGAVLGYNAFGYWQMQFTPAIPKTANDILTFAMRYSWGRV